MVWGRAAERRAEAGKANLPGASGGKFTPLATGKTRNIVGAVKAELQRPVHPAVGPHQTLVDRCGTNSGTSASGGWTPERARTPCHSSPRPTRTTKRGAQLLSRAPRGVHELAEPNLRVAYSSAQLVRANLSAEPWMSSSFSRATRIVVDRGVEITREPGSPWKWTAPGTVADPATLQEFLQKHRLTPVLVEEPFGPGQPSHEYLLLPRPVRHATIRTQNLQVRAAEHGTTDTVIFSPLSHAGWYTIVAGLLRSTPPS
jgi:hypothetical protein